MIDVNEIIQQTRAEVNAEWSTAWAEFSTVPIPKSPAELNAACIDLAKANHDTVRAEVLAACAQRGFDAAIEEGPPASVEQMATYIRDEILKLEPAAKDLNEILKQVRAKMLTSLKMVRVAMVQAMDALESDTELDERRKAFEVLQEQFEGVGDNNEAVSEKQAAQDLEELLRQERLKVTESSPECWHFNTETRDEFMERYFAWRKKNLAELEKARTSGGSRE